MIDRRALPAVQTALARQAAVALTGPRQVGKTTPAHTIASGALSIYLDLEARERRAKLADPALFLAYEDRLVVLDGIHRVTELFPTLRGLIDRGRRNGRRTSLFLTLGSAFMELLKQSSESLAGRIAYVEMGPLDVLLEVAGAGCNSTDLWTREGLPDSFVASSDAASLSWRKDFIRTYLERDVPLLGPRIPAEALESLWTMLGHDLGTRQD
jgi:predicted AAA+ superfamily ATPase